MAMENWKITIEVWPHSTDRGRDVDQGEAGERVQVFSVRAEDAKGALRMAECIVMGLEAGPMVWRAPIFGVVRDNS